MIRLAPSILSADFARLADSVAQIREQSDLLHLDVMDGHFVANITIGAPVVKALRSHTDLYFDCHLMISEPERYLDEFRDAGAGGCSVHVEVGRTKALIKQMRGLGLDVGLAVNPDTSFTEYRDHLADIDMVVLMTVYPGFGGQSFITEVLPKVEQTSEFIRAEGLSTRLEVDGGIDIDTAPVAVKAGADTLVAGSAIFGAVDPARAARLLKEAAGG